MLVAQSYLSHLTLEMLSITRSQPLKASHFTNKVVIVFKACFNEA